MAAKTKVLVGFSELVDRKPVQFVDDLISWKLCTLCGSVAKRVHIPTCSHVFCDVCYGQLLQRSTEHKYLCPLDNEVLTPGNVCVAECQEQDLGNIFCLNRKFGCKFSGPVADTLQQHYPGCSYHQVQCFKCFTTVTHLEIIQHVLSCRGSTPQTKGEASLLEGEPVEPAASLASVEEQVVAYQEPMSIYCSPAGVSKDRASEPFVFELERIHATVKSVKNDIQALLKEKTIPSSPYNASLLMALNRASEERLGIPASRQSSATDFKGVVSKEVEKKLADFFGTGVIHGKDDEIRDVVSRLNAMDEKLSLVQMRTCKTKGFWHVEGFDVFKNESNPDIQVCSRFSSPVLIAGYTVKLQVDIDKSEAPVAWLGMFAIFMKGPADEFLDWPVKKPLLFTLVHPEGGRKNKKKHLIPGARKDLMVCFTRPGESGVNEGCGFDRIVNLEAVEQEGFVLNDAITVALSIRQNMPVRLME